MLSLARRNHILCVCCRCCPLQEVPWLLEDKLKELGADYSRTEQDWGEYVVTDGNLITGQNPSKNSSWA